MLRQIVLPPKTLADYAEFFSENTLAEIRELAARLNGVRICHINATPYGGGVSELLRSMVPLYQGLGFDVHWRVIPPDPQFFVATKHLHNALQGSTTDLTPKVVSTYDAYTEELQKLFNYRQYDVVFVHDPQPAGLAAFRVGKVPYWVWRCHIDSSHPHVPTIQFLMPYLRAYDRLVFTMPEFVPNELRDRPISIMAPAIDPLSPKNMTLSPAMAQAILGWTGVRHDSPLVSQISRFDRWKDPFGVVRVFREVRKAYGKLQLAMVGQMALDDPEGWDLYRALQEETMGDPDIHVLTNFLGVGNMEVNAFQRNSAVIIQKSIREGFGLVVSEALWKGTPVVAGAHAGGIPLQIPPEASTLLAASDEEYVAKILQLLRDRERATLLGEAGKAYVQKHFLILRLLTDELKLLAELVGA